MRKLLTLGLVALGCCFIDGIECRAAAPPGALGLSVKVEDGWLTITAVHDNFPASRQGLRAGDRIAAIDGQSTQNQSLEECLKRLAGAAGEKIVLTISRGRPEAQPFEVTLVRQSRNRLPTDRGEPVQWKGNKIVSRVLPYPDLNSLSIRLPIAHAAAIGNGVKVAVLSLAEDKRLLSLLQEIAPRAEVVGRVCRSDELGENQTAQWLKQTGCRLAVVPDVPQWPQGALPGLVKRLMAEKILVVVPSDLSEAADQVEVVNQLQTLGALTVGRVGRDSGVMVREEAGRRTFNRRIREIHTDVFSTVGMVPAGHALDPVVTAGGVAALVLEKWPELSPAEVRERIVGGARQVWQGTSLESGQWLDPSVDPITTEYKPKDAPAVFRFRVLDAPGALRVDTEIPWFLNMLNCPKAWEITKGRGVVVAMSDQGFHLKHPELTNHIQSTKYFGPVTFERAGQHFHGTEMSRILLAVAPEARLVPILCSGVSFEALATNIARSFRYATELKADVVSASWVGYFNTNEALLAAARDVVDHGAVLSWFHYPKAYPGLLRSRFIYWAEQGASLGFADRFLTDPPGFHPLEIEAGLSGTAPQAAGLAALVRSVNPQLTPKEVEDLIAQNATSIGAGVLIPDAHKTVLAARRFTASGPPPSLKEAGSGPQSPPVRVPVPPQSEPVDYVLSKLQTHDLVMLGERHWTREEPRFVQQVLRRGYERNCLQYLFLECGRFEDQAKVERFLASPKYDPAPVLEVLRNSYEYGWGYQEYFDLFTLVHQENHKRPSSQWVRIVLVDGPPNNLSLAPELQKHYVEQSPLPKAKTVPLVGWLNDGTRDRDRFMATVIEMHLFQEGTRGKGVYFVGGSHIRKCLDQKDYGRRYFPAGALLAQAYPGRTFSVALHMPRFFWQDTNSFATMEDMFASSRKPMAFDTTLSSVGSLKLVNRLVKTGLPLRDVFDGYILLNLDAEYHRCVVMPEVYTDDFAKSLWGQLEADGMLARFLPPEMRQKPSGKALIQMLEQGLR